MATVSDRKLPKDNDADALVDYYKADVLKASDYYPFGMQMPGRHWTADSSDEYRFGFNGVEKDNELYGKGNAYAFEYRIQDSRIGRFLSGDPLILEEQKYPDLSPYQFSANVPIKYQDQEGLQPGSRSFEAGLAISSPSALDMHNEAENKGPDIDMSENDKEVLKGSLNILGGLSQTIAGGYATYQSGGSSAAIGSVSLMQLGMTQTGFGIAQVTDGLVNDDPKGVPGGVGQATLGASGNENLEFAGKMLDLGTSFGAGKLAGSTPLITPLVGSGASKGERTTSLTSDLIDLGKGFGTIYNNVNSNNKNSKGQGSSGNNDPKYTLDELQSFDDLTLPKNNGNDNKEKQ
jgi:RHS repeat-associated protein